MTSEEPQTNGERTEERHVETQVAFKKARRGEWAKRLGYVVALGTAAAIIVLQLVVLFAIRHQQQQAAPKIDYSAQALAILKDCQTPVGKCFQRYQESLAAAFGSSNEVQFYSLACFASLPEHSTAGGSLAYLRSCVTEFLKEND